jgi:NAD+ diphosphatase
MRCLMLLGEELWIDETGDTIRFLFEMPPLPDLCEEVAAGIFAAESATPPAAAARRVNLREVHSLCGEETFQLAGRARQLLHWRSSHRFCGHCGQPMQRHTSERAMLCENCGFIVYPRINPVVITLIHRGGSILLVRRCDPGFNHFWSLVAGFVEAGESLEEAVRREIREEVGLEVKNIRNSGSQQWPFPNNLMIGFYAEYQSGVPRPDGTEIAEAAWFTGDTLPRIPSKVSIARKLIDAFFTQDAKTLFTSLAFGTLILSDFAAHL